MRSECRLGVPNRHWTLKATSVARLWNYADGGSHSVVPGRQCCGLRVRDVATDRQPVGTRDGDVFIQTWAAVAASNKNARRVRRTSESALSFDDMLAALRDDGYFIGVVIDEAHLNFGASAKVAAEFYLDHIRPDFTILATATPNDDKLDAFEAKARIEVASRVVAPRSDVVAAGLNKESLKPDRLSSSPGFPLTR